MFERAVWLWLIHYAQAGGRCSGKLVVRCCTKLSFMCWYHSNFYVILFNIIYFVERFQFWNCEEKFSLPHTFFRSKRFILFWRLTHTAVLLGHKKDLRSLFLGTVGSVKGLGEGWGWEVFCVIQGVHNDSWQFTHLQKQVNRGMHGNCDKLRSRYFLFFSPI